MNHCSLSKRKEICLLHDRGKGNTEVEIAEWDKQRIQRKRSWPFCPTVAGREQIDVCGLVLDWLWDMKLSEKVL